MFIDGYLGLLTAIAGQVVTDCSLPGYARQPIAFGDPVDGVTFSAVPYTFGQALRGTGAIGRAIYDTPNVAGGAPPLLILPYPTPLATGRLPWDAGEAGHLRLYFQDMVTFHRGGAYSGLIAAGAVCGLTSDAYDVVSPADVSGRTPGLAPFQSDPLMANPRPLITTAVMMAGAALTIDRGVLQARARLQGVE